MATFRVLDLDLPPDMFAIVMATGIVSVAAYDHQYRWIGGALAAAASIMFVVLAIGLGIRILTRGGVILAQSRDPDVTLRMFTFVAGASVLGVVWRQFPVAVWILTILGLIGWLVLVPLGARGVWSRPPAELRDHVHGAWLLVSVGTAGLATSMADLAIIQRFRPLVIIGLLFWLAGIALYAAVTWLIAWRALVGPFQPDAVTPDSWILMGALAIATLAGGHLLKATDSLGALQGLSDWVGPATMAIWVIASLWIPILLYAEMWRVDQRPGSLRFAGVWWSAVFPLGMYSAATAATAAELHVPALATVSLVFFWIAVTVWAVVTVGLSRAAVAGLRTGSQ